MKKIIIITIILVVLTLVGGITYYGLHHYNRLKGIVQELKQECDVAEARALQAPVQIERIVSSSQVWRPIQDRAKDTVVQIFAHVAEIDILQPYKSPAQGTKSGSGFFINDQGDIITNAHVIDQAAAIWIQIPSLGKRILDAHVVGISPERDIALLKVTPDALEIIRKELGNVPFLPLGDSDLVRRSDEVLALGYPLGQQSLKSTTGVVSGHEQHLIQTSAPINPGNSGGPLVNIYGEVVGVNEANVPAAQNIGYAIPVNDLKIVLPDLYKIKLLRKPFLGLLFNNATDALTKYLSNPHPGGCYVVDVVKGSTLDRAGVYSGDMIYEINGYPVDIYGEMAVPWSEDKISLIDYASRLSLGEKVTLVVYRKGERKTISVVFDLAKQPAIRMVYPSYEPIDYEVFAGMVIMQLSINHIQALIKQVPGLAKFSEMKYMSMPILVITHIFPNSQLYRSRTVMIGTTINEVNGQPVATLADLRKAFKESLKTKTFTLRLSDNVGRSTDNIFVALDWEKIVQEEPRLSRDYRYPQSETAKEILSATKLQQELSKTVAAQ